MTMFEVGTPDTGASFDVVDGARLVFLRFDGLELLRTADPREATRSADSCSFRGLGSCPVRLWK